MKKTIKRIEERYEGLNPVVRLTDSFDRKAFAELLTDLRPDIDEDRMIALSEAEVKNLQDVGVTDFKKLIRSKQAEKVRTRLVKKINKHMLSLIQSEEDILFLESLVSDIVGLGPRLERLVEMVEGAKKRDGQASKSPVLPAICTRLGRFFVEQTGTKYKTGEWVTLEKGKLYKDSNGKNCDHTPSQKCSGACFIFAVVAEIYPERLGGLWEALKTTGLSDSINKK